MKLFTSMSLGLVFAASLGLATLQGSASTVNAPSSRLNDDFKLALNPPVLTPSGDPPGFVKPTLKKRNSAPIPRTNLIGPKGVLFYCGNTNACSDTFQINFSKIKSYYQAIGASPVEQLSTLPANLLKYRLIFVVLPQTIFTADQVSKLNSFLVKDRRLVVVGEWNGYWGTTFAGNDLLNRLNIPISFNSDAADTICFKSVNNFGVDPITKNLRTVGVEYAYTSTLNLGLGATKLLGTSSKAPFMAVYRRPYPVGDVVVTGDVSPFISYPGCDPSNEELWKNLLLRE